LFVEFLLVTRFVGLCHGCFASGLEISLDVNAIPVCANCLGENKQAIENISQKIPHQEIVIPVVTEPKKELEVVVTSN